MSAEEREEQEEITEEAERAANADRERLFRSSVPRLSDALLAARMAESTARSIGFDPDKIPSTVADNLRTIREQISRRQPPPLDPSQVPPNGE